MNDIDRMLDSLRDEFSERDKRELSEKSQRERALAAERSRAEAARVATARAALLDRARRYIVALDPRSREGRWFEDFAQHFATREDAAIEVVRAQDDVDRAL